MVSDVELDRLIQRIERGGPVSPTVVYPLLMELREWRQMERIIVRPKNSPMNWCDTCQDFTDMRVQIIGEDEWTDYICTCPICGKTTLA